MKSRMPHPVRDRGFTLIELVVTMAIVAMLVAIAYPSYRNYVLRGQITQATTGLSASFANMERYFQDNRTYVGGPCLTSSTFGTFTVSCQTSDVTGTAFLIKAVGSGGTSGFMYSIDQSNNQKSTAASPAPSAWHGCTTGWETKAGQC